MFKHIFNFHFYIWDLAIYYRDDLELSNPYLEDHYYFLTHCGVKRFLKQNETRLINDEYYISHHADKAALWL